MARKSSSSRSKRHSASTAQTQEEVAPPPEVPGESYRPVNGPGRSKFPLAARVFFAVAIPLATGVIVWFAVDAYLKRMSGNVSTFVCPEEAKQLANLVSTTVDPCRNFTQYVCADTAADNTDFRMRLFTRIVEGNSIQPESAAGRTLVAFFRSCSRMHWDDEAVLGNLTLAIMERGGVQSQMRAPGLLRFYILMSLQYGLASNVIVRQDVSMNERGNLTVSLILTGKNETMQDLQGRWPTKVNMVLKSFNEALGSNVSEDDVLRFGNVTDILMPSKVKDNVDPSLLGDLFEGVSQNDWNAILANASVSARHVTSVQVDSHLNHVMKVLSDPSHQHLAAAFVVTHAALDAFEPMIGLMQNVSHKSMKTSYCKRSLSSLEHTWELFQLQAVTTPAKDAELRKVFNQIVHSAVDLVPSGKVFSSKDHKVSQAQLEELDLLLPADYCGLERLPEITGNYVRDYFAALEYEYNEKQSKRKRLILNDPEERKQSFPLIARKYLAFPLGYYDFFTDLGGTSSFSCMMPWAGVSMAFKIWDFYVAATFWDNESLKKMNDFQLCVESAYLNVTVPTHVHALVFALRIVLRASPLLSHHEVKPGKGLSSSQFFFARTIYAFMCDPRRASRTGVTKTEVNAVFQKTPEFAEAFHCAAPPKLPDACSPFDP